MTALQSIGLLLILSLIIGLFYYIHSKRSNTRYGNTYRRFTKIIR